MTTSGNSDDKILLFSNTGPLIESNRMLFWKNTLKGKKKSLTKKKSWSIKQNILQKTIIAMFEVIEIIFWFAKDQYWVEIKQLTKFSRLKYHSTKCGSGLQTYKHDVTKDHGLQISGISRQQAPSMLVSIGAQHSHLHQVLLPILPFTPFVTTSLLLARSHTEFLP